MTSLRIVESALLTDNEVAFAQMRDAELATLADKASLSHVQYSHFVKEAEGTGCDPLLTYPQLEGFRLAKPKLERGKSELRRHHKKSAKLPEKRTNIGDPMPHHPNLEGSLSSYTAEAWPEAGETYKRNSRGQVK